MYDELADDIPETNEAPETTEHTDPDASETNDDLDAYLDAPRSWEL